MVMGPLEETPVFLVVNFFLKTFYLFTFGCVWAFSSCGKRGLLSSCSEGLLVEVASLGAEHGLPGRQHPVAAHVGSRVRAQ